MARRVRPLVAPALAAALVATSPGVPRAAAAGGTSADARTVGIPAIEAAETASASADDDAVAEPAGYRLENYDAPVPVGLAGAATVAAAEVIALVEHDDAVVVDVIPEHRRPASLPEGQTWFPVPHAGLPGALWLPDTGFGALAPVTERYFRDQLDRATGGDRTRPLVFYCRMDCWMSWNAAKRALAVGYTRVAWYRDGIDDWRFEDHPTEPLTPAPGARQPGDEIDGSAGTGSGTVADDERSR